VASAIVGNTPVVNDKSNANEDFVRCGLFNRYREFLRGLADNSPALNTVVRTFALYYAGRRLIFRDRNGEEIERATEVWNALFPDGEASWRKAVAKDMALLGDRAFEVVYNTLGQPAAIHHIDAMRLRCGKKDELGRVNFFRWCSNWELTNRYSKDYPQIRIPAWGTPEAKVAKKGIMFAKEYHQGQDYYGMPPYLAAITDVEVSVHIPQFNISQLRGGFKPGVLAHLQTNLDEADLEQLDKDFDEVFMGADGKPYMLTVGNKDEALTVTTLKRADHAGELDKMADRAEQVIYKSVGLPPILAGVDVSTGMSGKGLALDQSVTQFLRTQIQPVQWMITDDALRIIQLCGVAEAVSCEVEQLVPFDPATDPALQRQTYLRSRTVNEDRLAGGLGKLTIDGVPEEQGGELDPKGEMLLIEVGTGANMNEEQDANPKEDNPNG